MQNKTKIAVIGAGASGMMAAVTAAKYEAEVTLFEKNERVENVILEIRNFPWTSIIVRIRKSFAKCSEYFLCGMPLHFLKIQG